MEAMLMIEPPPLRRSAGIAECCGLGRSLSLVKVRLGGRVIAVDSVRGLKAARCGYLVVPENRARPTGPDDSAGGCHRVAGVADAGGRSRRVSLAAKDPARGRE